MTFKQFVKAHNLLRSSIHFGTSKKTYPGSTVNIRFFYLDKYVGKQNILFLTKRAAEAYLNKDVKLETLTVVFNESYRIGIMMPNKYKSIAQNDTFQKYKMEPNIPDYIYKSVAVAFAKAFANGNVSPLRPFISDKTYLTIYTKYKLSGTQCVLDYFTNWFERVTKENLNVMVAVKWQSNQCRPAVYIKPTNNKEMVLLFRVKNGVLADIVFAPSLLQDCSCTFHDLNQPSFSVDFVSNFLGEGEKPQNYHLPCPICGLESKSLDWYKFQIPMGTHGYIGAVSICSSCKKVIELVPNARIEYNEPQWMVSEKPLSENTSVVIPKLVGIYTFDTENEKTFYPCAYDERREACHNSLKEYRQSGDIEKGNDAAIIFANSSFYDEAIELFIELSKKGCHNAMLNLFTVYWSSGTQEGYEKAAAWLKYIAAGDNPSIKCLWNLVVLYYYGENLPNNTLPKDHAKAKGVLSQIKDMSMAGKSIDIIRVIVNAQKFYQLIDRLNEFSLTGKEIHDVMNHIAKAKDFKGAGELFYRAQFLSLKPGYKLGLHVAGETMHDTRWRESYFFIYDNNGNEYEIFKSRTILDDVDTSLINVAPTAMGAWQLYLLITSPAIMPMFWSSDYDARTFVFLSKT